MASMAGVRGVAILALVVVVWIAEGPTVAVAITRTPNGLPRPDGYTLTSSYGPTPPCLRNGTAVTCDWYGFSYALYPTDALDCLLVTRTILANTTRFPPGILLPYEYYYLTEFIFNTVTNNSYCLYGCFDMSYTGPAPAPVANAPAPSTLFSPPPPPAPSTLFSPPPPPVLASPPPPPVLVSPPPSNLASPPPPSLLVSPPPPVTRSTPPPPSGTSGTSPPPSPTTVSAPPPPPRVFDLNDAGFLRVPTGLVWFAVSGALLILSGLVAC